MMVYNFGNSTAILRNTRSSCVLLVSTLILLLFTGTAYSQPQFQQSTLYGGTIFALEWDSVANTLVAATSNGLYQSSDGGSSWITTPIPLTYRHCQHLFIHPNNQFYYAIPLGVSGYLRSTNHGQSWTNFHPPPGAGIGLFGLTVNRATGTMIAPVDSFARLLIYRSTNSGDSWQCVFRSNPGEVYHPQTAFCSNAGNIFVPLNGRVFRSSNDGVSWQSITSGVPTENISAMGEGLSTEICLGTESGVLYRSSDQGMNWSSYTTIPGIIEAFAKAPTGEIFVATDYYFYRKLSESATWTIIDPAPHTWRINFDLQMVGSTLYTAGENLYRTTDLGNSWQWASNGISSKIHSYVAFNPRNDIFVSGYNGISKSTDHGETWSVDSICTIVHVIYCADSVYAYATGIYGEFFRSTNAGISWRRTHTFHYFVGNPQLDTDGSLLIAADAGLYRSTDHGLNWQMISTQVGLTIVNAQGIYFAGTFSQGVMRSTDHGVSWQNVLPPFGAIGVSMGRVGLNTIYLVWTENFKFSRDNGNSWITANLPPATMSNLINPPYEDENGVFYIGYNYTLYRSTTNGATWTDLHLPADVEWIDRSLDGYLYVTTAGQGLFRSVSPISDVEEPKFIQIPTSMELHQNFPNPFNSTTKITFSLPVARETEIHVYNSLGQNVKSLHWNQLPAGQNQIEFSSEGLATGVYWYRLQSGQTTLTKQMTILK